MKNKRYIIGISLIVLIFSIIIVTCFIMNTNAETVANQSLEEIIEAEKTFVKMTATLSRATDSNNKVNISTIQSSLNNYAGHKYRATVSESSSDLLLIEFAETGNQYEININTALTRDPAIGDYVKYTPASFGNYQVTKASSGYRDGPETYTGSYMAGIKWRILNIDESTGVVQIVSESFGRTGINAKGHYFEGSTGFSNGKTVLDAICSNVLKTNTDVATGTRSLTAADVNTLVGYIPSGEYEGYVYGQKYGSSTHTYYTYNIESQTNDAGKLALINDFFTEGDGIWLPERAVKVKNSAGTSWERGLLFVTNKSIGSYNQYMSNDSGNYSHHGVAAVVTLKPTVNLVNYSSTDGWEIQ